MAIRLIDQYPNRAGVPNADYPHGVPRNKSTPTSTDGTPFEQAWFRDQEGFFQGLLETAGVTPSGSPDTVEQSDYFDALVSAMHGVTEVDVGGVGDVTLGIYPSRVAALRLTGVLGANVDLIVPNAERIYTIIDETTGGFSVTVRTEAGLGVIIGEPVSVVRSDGADVVGANPAPDLGQNIVVFDTAGVTEWDVPEVLQAGLRKAHVTVVGGGGGGGATSDTGGSEASNGGGGAGGGAKISIVDLSSESSVTVTVGSGGGGGSGQGGAGQTGGSSSFGTFVSAPGGEGGSGSLSSSLTNRSSGGLSQGDLGGQGIFIRGGDGSIGVVISGTAAVSGDGGGTLLCGTTRSGSASAGRNALGFGGGGSGASALGSSTARTGGDGASGIVIVRW